MAVLSDGRLVVADNAVGCVFILDDAGNESTLIGSKSTSSRHLHLINAVYTTPNDDIIVCDHRLQVHSRINMENPKTSGTRDGSGGKFRNLVKSRSLNITLVGLWTRPVFKWHLTRAQQVLGWLIVA